MNKVKKVLKNVLSIFSYSIFITVIFINACLISLSFYGSNTNVGLSNVAKKVTNSNENEIALISEIKTNNQEEINSIIENHTYSKPFYNCVSRITTASIKGYNVSIIDVPACDHKYYSYNHIYSENAWTNFTKGTIVLSSEFYSVIGAKNIGVITVFNNNNSFDFAVAGFCEGTSNFKRDRLGNLLSDSLGYYAVVLREDFESFTTEKLMKTINIGTNDNRTVQNNVNSWINDPLINNRKTLLTNNELNSILKFNNFISDFKPFFIPIGIISTLILIASFVAFLILYIDDSKKSKLTKFIVPMISLVMFFVLVVLLSIIVLPLSFGNVSLSNVGLLIAPLSIGALLTAILFFLLLKKEKQFDFLSKPDSNGKKTIWILNHYATTPSNGPLPRHYYLAKRFMKAGYNVSIFASNQLHATDNEVSIRKGFFREITENGVRFIFVKTIRYHGNGIKRILNIFSFYLALLIHWDQIANVIGKPDIVIASSAHLWTCLAGLRIAKELNIPCISEVRDLWPEELFTVGKVKENSIFGKYLLNIEKKIYRNSDALVFTKEGDTDHIKEMKWDTANGGKIDLDKCYYINNGVDFEEWNENLTKNPFKYDGLEDKTFKVGYAGSIRPMNSVDFLVDTAELLKDKKDIHFYIAGSGSLLEQLKQDSANRKLNNITFIGYLDKKTVPSFLSQMNVNILMYSNDKYNWSRGNSSNKLFEYMAAGKPIISTVKTGYSIINKYECGTELNEYTPNELANSVLSFKKMSKKKYDKICNNSCTSAKDFDFDALSLKYLGIINKLLEDNKRGEENE